MLIRVVAVTALTPHIVSDDDINIKPITKRLICCAS
jgi:hypothetical protein